MPRWPLILVFVSSLLVGCSSAPKDVAQAWSRYRRVKIGMSQERVRSLIGEPPTYSTGWACPYDLWRVGDDPPENHYWAGLVVVYDFDRNARAITNRDSLQRS